MSHFFPLASTTEAQDIYACGLAALDASWMCHQDCLERVIALQASSHSLLAKYCKVMGHTHAYSDAQQQSSVYDDASHVLRTAIVVGLQELQKEHKDKAGATPIITIKSEESEDSSVQEVGPSKGSQQTRVLIVAQHVRSF